MNHKKEHRKTIYTIAIGFLILSYFLKNIWLCGFAIGIGTLGLLFQNIAAFIHDAWMGLAKIMGRITQPIILGLVYYLILCPVSMISKINRKDPFMLKNRNQSTFRDTNKSFPKETFEKTW